MDRQVKRDIEAFCGIEQPELRRIHLLWSALAGALLVLCVTWLGPTDQAAAQVTAAEACK